MTDTKAPEQEIESLRNHNSQLLAELKTAKSRIAELSDQLQAASEVSEGLQADLTKIKLQGPVEALADDVSVYSKAFLSDFREMGYDFYLEGDNIVIRDSEGNPAMVGERIYVNGKEQTKMRPAKFDSQDVRQLCEQTWLPEDQRSPLCATFPKLLKGSQANGGGVSPTSTNIAYAAKATSKPAERLPTGLR